MIEDKELFIPPVVRKYEDEDESMDSFHKHKRHVFVFTQAGRPIYTRYGDELRLATYIATISTIFQKLMLAKSDQEKESKVRMIENEKTKTVVIYREKLVLMIVSSDKNDSLLYLTSILDNVNIQIISIITNMINAHLEKRPSFDPRPMMGGTTNALGICIKNAIKSPGIFLHSFMSHPLNSQVRSTATNILKSYHHSDNTFTLLLSPFGIFSLYKPKKTSINSDDILLLMNLLHSSQALRASASWVPICLPGISNAGFLYAYIYFHTKNIGLVTITDVTDVSMFTELNTRGKAIFKELAQNKVLDSLNNSLLSLPYSEDIPNLKNLRHFMIKQVDGCQYTMSRFLPYGEQQKESKKYVQIFARLYEKYLECSSSKRKDFYYIEQKEDAYYCLCSNGDYLLFLDYNQLEPVEKLHQVTKDLIKWIKSEETNYFVKM